MKIALFIISIIVFIMGCGTKSENTLFQKLDKTPQSFFIDNNKDTLIQGAEGTLIFIEKESFMDRNGYVQTDSIEIVLKELYQVEDIIPQRISMMAGDELLETGGMVHLQAFSKDEELRLDYSKKLVVHFPKSGESKDMNLFYGKEGDTGIIEWDVEESSTYRLRNEIGVWYTKYEYLDDSMLYIHDRRTVYDTVYRHFDFTESEIEELLNKTVDAKYEIDDEGFLEYEEMAGSRISRELRNKIVGKVKSFPRCRPYTREGDPIDMPGWFRFWTEVIPPRYESKEGYKAAIEEKLATDDTNGLDIAELQYYIFDSRKLGWMNCDRFVNPSSENVDYTVVVPKSENIFVKIVFTDYNSVMTGDEKEGAFVFENLPEGEAVKIVALDEKNGKPLLKIIDTAIRESPFEVGELTEYTLEELDEKLKEIR